MESSQEEVLALQHEHEDGATWSDTEPAEDAAAQAVEGDADSQVMQSQEELRDGPTDITDSQQARDTIQRCSVIVGMHPDQVADSAAMRHASLWCMQHACNKAECSLACYQPQLTCSCNASQ